MTELSPVVVQHSAAIALPVPRLTANDIVARTRLVREVMEAVMQEGVHYGKIPGTEKASLWQPGAEKLLMTFQLEPVLEVEDLSIFGEVARYRVLARIRHVPSGEYVGAGVGECSSDEEKYKWRRAVCKEEFEATPIDRRRVKYARKRDGGTYTVEQVRTEPADVANTILKMAKKRALVDGSKSSTAASDIFDQDLEDLPAELIQPDGEGTRTAPAEPQRKTEEQKPEPKNVTPREPGATVIPADRWKAVKEQLHTRGTISEPQAKRLFAKAVGNGWTKEQLRSELQDGLGVEKSSEIPSGKPYDLTCALFEEFKP